LDRREDVLTIDSFSFLVFAFFACLARNERNKLRDAFLNGLLGILGDFGIIRQGFFHDSTNIRNGKKSGVIG
jgi:hypothetical protein